MEDNSNNNNPANRSCAGQVSLMRPTSSTNNSKRYLSLAARVNRLAATSLFGLVIILSCLRPSIIAASDVAPADFELMNSPIGGGGESPASGSRSLPYISSSISSNNFDPSTYKNIHEAIRNHPDLQEFANLCELDGVKEIVSMDRTPLTVFAPIDRSLRDLLAKSKARSINLIELAKHHIAQGLVTPDENSKYPLQFNDYALLSPLYLNQQQHQPAVKGQRGQQQQAGAVFVNNAKILATYLIQIDSDNFQALHLIDQPIEFAYLSKLTQLPSSGRVAKAGQRKTATKKSKFSLDDLLADQQQQVTYEFHERFGDLQANQHQVDLYHTRAYKGPQEQRLLIDRDHFNLEQLGRIIRQQPKLRAKLFHVNESNSYNTYFLPMNNEHLASLLDGSKQLPVLEALVIPDQVLFTRLMALGVAHSTLFDRLNPAGPQRVSLSLAKSLPSEDSPNSSEEADESQTSRRLLSTPLLLQAKCQTVPSSVSASAQGSSVGETCRPGITSVEVLVANIPLSNGVLHLIRRPPLLTEQTNVLAYLNNNDNRFSDLVAALGSRTTSSHQHQHQRQDQDPNNIGEVATKLKRFSELLVREKEILFRLTSNEGNRTLLVPSDKAFASLRYDLRALVMGDESLIPKDWSESYRQDLLKRFVRSHLVPHESITTDQLDMQQQPLQALSDNGRPLSFIVQPSSEGGESEYFIECDSTRARLIQHDLMGSNGVVHVIDRVLGEEQETVHSLLKSIVVKYNRERASSEELASASDLSQLIESSIRENKQQISSSSSSQEQQPQANSQQQDQQQQDPPQNPELQAISKSIGRYLVELSNSSPANRRQLQQLASSVNISYQLARSTSLAEGLDDWNDKFRQAERMFTYFVPSDLAWIRLQQAQPELYKPLMHFLEHHQGDDELATSGVANEQSQPASNSIGQLVDAAPAKPTTARSSESSHRLRQILERHLVLDRKIDARNLNQLDSVRTMGATLRLVESPSQSQLTATYSGDGSNLSGQPAAQSSNFAALHSIFTGTSSSSSSSSSAAASSQQTPNQKLKSLKLDSASANIVQAIEASNGFVYVIDNVLLLPEDSNYIVQTSQSPAVSSSMSSLLGAHNSAIFDFVHGFLAPAPLNMSTNSILALMATLTVAILVLLMLALVLVVRKSRQNKQNRHQQLESGLTSSSSANSGSTSTTKSL